MLIKKKNLVQQINTVYAQGQESGDYAVHSLRKDVLNHKPWVQEFILDKNHYLDYAAYWVLNWRLVMNNNPVIYTDYFWKEPLLICPVKTTQITEQEV